MNLTSKLAATLIAAALALPMASPAAAAEPVDQAQAELTALGVVDLHLVPIEGIVIVRGKVRDRATWDAVQSRLVSLGFNRIANLTRIVPLPSDEFLTSRAERQLSLARGLAGSNLRVATRSGIVTIEGTVQNQAQMDAARDLVRRIDGVQDVRIVATNL